MPKDCTFNDLSISDAKHDDGHEKISRLVELFRIVGRDAVMWLPAAIYSAEAFKKADKLIRQKGTRDRLRIWKSFLDTASWFGDEASPQASYQGTPAVGLGLAYHLKGIALSIEDDKWREPWLDIVLHKPDVSEAAKVRHADREASLQGHEEWTALTDADRLRVLLHLRPSRHNPASTYAKHVRGANNGARQENASRPSAPGQFLAQTADGQVTDATIQMWERQAFAIVDNGGDCIVASHGGAYHVYCNLGHVVGYIGGTGRETHWIRVEWSAGFVHSHPHEPA